jgi:hypothetical protein
MARWMDGGEVVLREGERRVRGSVREVEEKGGGVSAGKDEVAGAGQVMAIDDVELFLQS